MNVEVRKARPGDCEQVARLGLLAGEGIPAYFWAQQRRGEESILAVGTRLAASEQDNFSYRNAQLALVDGTVAGMLLAYRLPDAEHADDPNDYPAFLRPLIELERCVPNSFYINMIATYPAVRGRGIGTLLMGVADRLAREAGCDVISIQVFEQNEGARTLYQRLGYEVIDRREVMPHESHPYTGQLLLLTKPTAAG